MLEYIKNELEFFGIDTVGSIPLEKCTVTRDHKLKRCEFDQHTDINVIIFAIPYYTEHKEKNISSYAIPRDYHLFCKNLSDKLLPGLESHFPAYKFSFFSDDSPIDERDAAVKAGLGILGDNGLIITEKYSSYVFLAEIITNLPLETKEHEIKKCEGCGMCRAVCPISDIGVCLSFLTQKKGELSNNETNSIKKYKCAWGCDLCQESCPHTIKAIKDRTIHTQIDFFKQELTPILTKKLIENMSDEEFSKRAYSWRKKETILRNLSILEE